MGQANRPAMTARRVDPAIAGLSNAERELLIEALCALRDARGRAWNIACDQAEREGKRRPSIKRYGIEAIVRLARRLGGDAPHRLER